MSESSFEKGEKFVRAVIEKIPSGVDIIKEYRSLGNKFDLILTHPSKKRGANRIISDNKEAEKLIREAKSIIIIECSKPGKFKSIKENFGEILKLPSLNDEIIRKIRAICFVHEEIKEPKYKNHLKKLNQILFNPNFKIELIELEELRDRILELISYMKTYT